MLDIELRSIFDGYQHWNYYLRLLVGVDNVYEIYLNCVPIYVNKQCMNYNRSNFAGADVREIWLNNAAFWLPIHIDLWLYIGHMMLPHVST